MTLHKTTVLLFFLSSFALEAQEEAIAKIESLSDKSWNISLDNPQEAIFLSLEALRLSDSIGYIKGQRFNHSCLGLYYTDINNFAKAEEHLQRAVAIRTGIGDEKGIVSDYEKLSSLKKIQGDYFKAIEYGLKGLELLNSLGLPEQEKNTFLLNLAIIYAANRDTLEAITYYQSALNSALATNDTFNLTLAHYNKALFHYEMEELDSAEINVRTALLTVNELTQKKVLGSLYELLGVIYTKQENYLSALEYLNRGIDVHKELKDTFRLFENQLSIAGLYHQKGEQYTALQFCNSAKLNMKSFDRISAREKLYRLYSKIYDKLEDSAKAYQYYVRAETIEDSIFNIAKSESIQLLQRRHAELNTAKAEQNAAEVSAKNYRLGIYIIIVSVLALVIALLLNRGRVKKEHELIEYKKVQEEITTQRIITGNKKTRKDLSVKLHDHVSRPLTHIKRLLEFIHQELSFDEELVKKIQHATKIADRTYTVSRDISYELRPATIDWVDNIKLSLSGIKAINPILKVTKLKEDDFTKEKGMKISAIVGNILSNVEKHAQAENVTVVIEREDDILNILVEDDGIGFNTETTKGVGLESVDMYVEELGGSVSTKSDPQEGGTQTIIKLPL